MAIYFIQIIFGRYVDLLPCGYVLMEYVILGIIHRIALYDVSQVVVDASEERKELGYIIFDIKKAYVGANAVAKYYFPEIEKLDIDSVVTEPFIKSEFVDSIDDFLNKEDYYKTFNRRDRILTCSAKPYVYGKRKKLYGYIVEIKDDTRQQRLISTLNDMNVELEVAANQATSANRAKSDFLASMSHEIRTPINAILGMNEIALRECEDESLISYMQEIKSAGNNLLFIINDILDFSKIEAGRIEIIECDYNPLKLLTDVKNMVEIKAAQKSLNLSFDIDATLPSVVRGDENRIRQILINLVNNAVKYTQNGSVSVTVKADRVDDSLCELLFQVRDTGIGIKKESLPVIFDSFSRVDEKKNAGIEGTGLGLAITKRLVELMNGTIQVESEYGKGSVFSVTLKQQIVDGTQAGTFEMACEKSEEKINRKHMDFSNMDILVVDDNKVNLKVAKGLLGPTGANVVLSKSGEESLRIMSKKHFDVILLDHMMPEMDGIQTLHKAKESLDNLCKESSFIALTANALSGVREMYLSEGFDDYISKPIDPVVLETIIAKYKK